MQPLWRVPLFLLLLASAMVSAQTATASNAEQSKVVLEDSPLDVLKSLPAPYPSKAQEGGIQGKVVLKVTVSEKGEVQNAEVTHGDPILADSAVKTVKQWKFRPCVKQGKAIPVVTLIPFYFAFQDKVIDVKPGAKSDKTAKKQETNESDKASAGVTRVSPNRVRLSVDFPGLIHKVVPVYPPEAKREHIDGTVLFRAVIDKEGNVMELTPVSGPKELIPAATGAVEQWRYSPYILEGTPVEVETTITVNFNLQP